MKNTLSITVFAALVSVVAGQTGKLAEPKVIEEDGKKIRVFVIGSTVDSITVGSARYTFLRLEQSPKTTPRGAFQCGYSLVNVGPKGKSVERKVNYLTRKEYAVVGEQNEAVRSYRADIGGPDELWPGIGVAMVKTSFRPIPDKSVTAFKIEYQSKEEGIDTWRVVYPRKTWGISKSQLP